MRFSRNCLENWFLLLVLGKIKIVFLWIELVAMLFLIFIRESLFSFFIGVINILFVMKNYIHSILGVHC